MGYSIYLSDPVTREVLELDEPHFMRGGMYKLGGDTELRLYITYNYSDWYYRDDTFGDKVETEEGSTGGIRTLYGMTGLESIPLLERVINVLENLDEDLIEEDLTEEEIKEYRNDCGGSYWVPTRVNALKPLYQLLTMAKMRPDGVWQGD